MNNQGEFNGYDYGTTLQYCGKHNAKAVKIKSGEAFKTWLETIKPELRESVTAHRRTYIRIMELNK